MKDKIYFKTVEKGKLDRYVIDFNNLNEKVSRLKKEQEYLDSKSINLITDIQIVLGEIEQLKKLLKLN